MRAENPGTMRVLDLIRKHKPSVIRVTLSDGEVKEVEVRGGRSRWSPAARTVATYGWARIELIGAKGAVLHVADNDAPAANDNDDGPPMGARMTELAHLMRITNAHADLAVQRHIEALKPTLTAMQMQVSMLAEQLVAERREAARTMESAAELAESMAKMAKGIQEQGGEAGGSDLLQMLQMMPALMKMLPPAGARVVVQPKKPPAKPNGTTVKREAFEGVEPKGD